MKYILMSLVSFMFTFSVFSKEFVVDINTRVSTKYSEINEKYLIKLGSYGLFNRLNIIKNLDKGFD